MNDMPPLPEPKGILHDAMGNDPLTFERWPHDPERDIVCSTMQVFGADQMHAYAVTYAAFSAAQERETIRQLRSVLRVIVEQDPIENCLDPQWAARICKGGLDATAIRGTT